MDGIVGLESSVESSRIESSEKCVTVSVASCIICLIESRMVVLLRVKREDDDKTGEKKERINSNG